MVTNGVLGISLIPASENEVDVCKDLNHSCFFYKHILMLK